MTTSTDSAFQVGDRCRSTRYPVWGDLTVVKLRPLYKSVVCHGSGYYAKVTGAFDQSDIKRIPDAGKGKAPVEAKGDPYKQDRPPGFVPWAALQDERHRQTLAALDRKVEPVRRGLPDRSRGATICTRRLATPKRVKDGHPAAWPSQEGEDP